MRRPGCAVVVLAFLTLAAACSKQDQANVAADAHSASQDAKSAIAKVANNPDVKHAEADVKQMGHDAAVEIRKTAAEAKNATHQVANDAKHAVHGAADTDKRRKDESNS
jgi:hypothetical protein